VARAVTARRALRKVTSQVYNLVGCRVRSYPMWRYDCDVLPIFTDQETPGRPHRVRFAIGPDGKKAANGMIDSIGDAWSGRGD
jgi:hypothetical protein